MFVIFGICQNFAAVPSLCRQIHVAVLDFTLNIQSDKHGYIMLFKISAQCEIGTKIFYFQRLVSSQSSLASDRSQSIF